MTEQTPDPEIPAAKSTAVDAVELAAETLGKDLLEALITEVQQSHVGWDNMTQIQQDGTIERLRRRVQILVGEALRVLFAGEFPATPATLVGLTCRKGIKAVLDISRSGHSRYELMDSIGRQVLVVIANPDDYTARMAEVRARQKQGDLFQAKSGVAHGEGYVGGDGDPYRRGEGDDVDSPAERITYDPDAPAPDLELEKGPLWEQAMTALATVGVKVDPTIACDWTHNQCAQAAFWAGRKEADPDVTPEAPPFVLAALVPDEEPGEQLPLPGPADDTQ